MLRPILRKVIDKAEGAFGESLEYLRFILDSSVEAFFQFARLTRVSRYRRVLPKAAFHAVRITTTCNEDCGPCVQTTVNIARKDGVAPDVLRAIVTGKTEQLPEEVADVVLFVEKVMNKTNDEGELREKIRAAYGARGNAALSEIALVLSSARAFPVTKRVLGFATSCSRVTIDVGEKAPVRARAVTDQASRASRIAPARG